MKIKFNKQSFFAAFVGIISTIFALAMGEGVLRLVGFEFALYPTKIQFGWPDPVTLQNYYQVDRELLWVPKDYPSRVANWKEKRPTAVFMGDSCTEFGRYDEFLKSMVYAQDPSADFTFVNVGVGGWSSYQGLQQLERDVIPMKPRFITMYYGWNDHWTSFGIEDKEIGNFNLEHSALLLEAFNNVRLVQLVNKAAFAFKQASTEKDQRKPERVSLSDFRSNLLQMVRLARNNGIVPILITAPSSHKKGEEPAYLARRWLNDLRELVPVHREYVQVVRDVSSAEGVPLIDLFAEFDQMSRTELDKFFTKDGIHLTSEGNKEIAGYIYDHLAGNGMYN